MISNFIVYLIFATIIISYTAYKLAPFLEGRKLTGSKYQQFGGGGGGGDNSHINPTVLDHIKESRHGYQLSDCSITDVNCSRHSECNSVCVPADLNWHCDKAVGVCRAKDAKGQLACVHGILRHTAVHNDPTDKYKNTCVCTTPHLYTGPNCSIVHPLCDAVERDRCFCKNDKSLFKWNVDGELQLEMCVPNDHLRIFSNQDNFKRIGADDQTIDWLNFF